MHASFPFFAASTVLVSFASLVDILANAVTDLITRKASVLLAKQVRPDGLQYRRLITETDQETDLCIRTWYVQ